MAIYTLRHDNKNTTTAPVLTVVIPALNEAEHLPFLLQDLASQKQVSLEVIVADGGSTDISCSIAEKFNVRFVVSQRGRGRQMNAAAGIASGDYLLFLHGDSRIDDDTLLARALEALRQSTDKAGIGAVAGHFRLRFIRTTGDNTMAYRYAEEKSALNRANTTNGDQGMLLSRDFFTRLGGFDESLPFLEDQRIAEKIRTHGFWITLPGCLGTSARRFEAEGFHRRYIMMSMMMGLFSVGEHSFFSRAPQVYRLQQDTGRLLLTPFFGIIWQMMREEWRFPGTLRVFYRLGRYIRGNSWQMFFFFDVMIRPVLGVGRYPMLAFHDRVIKVLINSRLCDVITGLFCFCWFMGVLAPWYSCLDHYACKAYEKKG